MCFFAECEKSRWTKWGLENQPPTSLCTVDKVEVWSDQEINSICSGECEDELFCAGDGNVVGIRYLTCEGVDGECCSEI